MLLCERSAGLALEVLLEGDGLLLVAEGDGGFEPPGGKLRRVRHFACVVSLEAGGQVKLSALALAGWCQYLLGKDDAGHDIAISPDPRLAEAQEYARASVSDPAAPLHFTDVFGGRLPADERFVSAFTDALTSIREQGTYRTLERWLNGAS